MTDLLAPWPRVPLPSSWGLPQAQGAAVGEQVARYLRRTSQAVGAAVARMLPEGRVPALEPGPWERPGSVTPGPAGWFSLAARARRTGFRLDGRPPSAPELSAADLARAIWHCPRWRGRPVLLVTQPSAPADGAGPLLRQLAVDLGAPVYASDAGVRFTYGRAFSGGLFWCWRPDSAEPEPAGRLLPPLGPVRTRPGTGERAPGRHRYRQPPVPVPPVVPPTTATPLVVPSPVVPEAPAPPAALAVAVPVVDVPRFDLGVHRVVLPEFPSPAVDLDTLRPQAIARPLVAAPSTVDAVARTSAVPVAGRPAAATDAAAPARTAVAVAAPPTGATPAVVARAAEVPAPAVPQAGATREVPKVELVAVAAEAAWFGVRAHTEEADRERLRTTLGWKFQAHSRTVSRALSMHPGLRGAVGAHDVMAGLVAVLALLDGVGQRVNSALRGGGVPDEEVRMLARCACAGLVQLPAVGGPVFAGVPAGADVTGRYRTGELIVEPAFTEVSLAGAGTGPRYAIWSATARRLDQLGTPGQPAARSGRAMFPAGTRFAVLGADDGPDGAPCVLLREIVFEHRDGGLDERVAGKLRDALGRTAPAGPRAVEPLPWPLGLTPDRRPFLSRPAGPEGEKP